MSFQSQISYGDVLSKTASPSTKTIPEDAQKKKKASLRNPLQQVTIIAGKGAESQSFIVHKDFACHYSPVFKAAFGREFIEGRTQTYQLEDFTKGAVRLLIHWLYTQELDSLQLEDPKCKKGEDMYLVQLWVLADKLLVPRLQNLIIRQIDDNRVQTKKIPVATLPYIYKNTSNCSPLRRLLIDQFACCAMEKWMFEEWYPQEMFSELAARLLALRDEDKKVKAINERDMESYNVPDREAL